MSARVTPDAETAATGSDIESRMRDEGLQPRSWSNGPGDTYGWHRHEYHKVLYCVSGSIVFHTREDGDLELLDVEPGTDHAATVGDEGVRCVEAPRS